VGSDCAQDKELLKWADTPDEAFQQLRQHLEAHHLEPKTQQEKEAPGIAKTRARGDNSVTAGHQIPQYAASMDQQTRQTLVTKYKDGYRAVADALSGATEASSMRGRAGEVVRARESCIIWPTAR